jgi:hypothetical protein
MSFEVRMSFSHHAYIIYLQTLAFLLGLQLIDYQPLQEYDILLVQLMFFCHVNEFLKVEQFSHQLNQGSTL